MIVCKTYNEVKLAAIKLLAEYDSYVSHLHIIRVDGTYYIDYEEDYKYADDEYEGEVE